jgi:hypothetical protein
MLYWKAQREKQISDSEKSYEGEILSMRSSDNDSTPVQPSE